HKHAVSAVAFFKDGRRVVTGSWDRTVQIWDVEERALVGRPLLGHIDFVYSIAISPDDRRIASGGQDKAIIIWDVDSQQRRRRLVRHIGEIWSLCFSPDGKKLASGSHDKRVIIWDAETGVVLSILKGSDSPVFRVAFSPYGPKLASGTQCKIQVWNTDNAQAEPPILDIDAHKDWVHIVWSPDGQQIVSASEDKTVKFWDSLDGTQISGPYTHHTNDINSLAISSDGSFIATASDDKTVCLWSIKQMDQPLKLEHTALVFCVAFSRSGELLATGDSSGNLQLW
ncbi:WD40 repeat-like protein, partial [Suillus decipiens]